jgi:hypothetical protein
MFNNWKSHLQSLMRDASARKRTDADDADGDPEIVRFRNLLADMRRSKASDELDGPVSSAVVSENAAPNSFRESIAPDVAGPKVVHTNGAKANGVVASPPSDAVTEPQTAEPEVAEPQAVVPEAVVAEPAVPQAVAAETDVTEASVPDAVVPEAALADVETSNAHAEPASTPQVDAGALAGSPEALSLAQEFVSKQREATEALLREVVELEGRLRTEARAAEARAELETFKEKADAAAALVQQAEDEAAAAAERRQAVAAQCAEADQRVTAAHQDAEAAKARAADLQQQLQDAQQAAEEAAATLDQRETYAKEFADKLDAAARDETDAAELVEMRQAAWAAAEKDVQAAEVRVEQLTNELTPQDVAAINTVQVLAARIAEDALKLKPGS